MPIVLAIEPDRRQAAHLAAIVRQLAGAELLLADTTEGALDAIGDRIPDLVLVPALLSPQDDAALAAALRVIAAAAHVRTLTIPVLSSGTPRTAVGGMLAKWRKPRAASPEPDGCDPAVFGEQISTYLREAAAERAQIEDDLMDQEPAALAPAALVREVAIPVAEAAWVAPIAAIEPIVANEGLLAIEAVGPTEEIEATESGVEADGVDAIELGTAEPIQWWAAQPVDEPVDEPVDQPVDQPIEEPSIELDEALIDLSSDLEGLSEQSDDERFDGDPVGVYTISAQADEPELDTLDRLPSIEAIAELEPDAIGEPIEAAIAAAPETALEITEPLFDESLFVESLFAEPPFVAPALVESFFVEPPEPPRADIQPWVPMYLTPGRLWPAMEGMPAETPAPRTDQPDWIELVASLRQDLERRRTDPAAPADPIAARPSDGAHAVAHQLVKTPRVHARKAKPVQDEWGFFDPEQCGFSTLLAKLEEITEDSRL